MISILRKWKFAALSLVSGLALMGMGDCGGEQNLRVLVTDAPFPYSDVQAALVTIDRIDIKGNPDGTGSAKQATVHDIPMTIDLMGLRNGLTDILSELDVEPGEYKEARLIISEGALILKDGRELKMTVSSGDSSGLKVKIKPHLTVVTELSADLLFDIDLSKSFNIKRKADGTIEEAKFSPVVRAANLTTAGTISGTVTDAETGLPVAGALVTVSATTGEGTIEATSVTEANGTYSVIGLDPGLTLDLTVSAETYGDAERLGLAVTLGNETKVDVALTPAE